MEGDSRAAYPWRGVMLAGLCTLVLLALGTLLIDAAFEWRTTQEDPRYSRFSGTCYWAGDARNYMRIALAGYSDYTPALHPPHMIYLNDRSWWPLFPALIRPVIDLGGGMCSGRLVNGIALVALVPIFQALTHERRWWRLPVVAVMPFGAWLAVGEADSFFLAVSGLLLLAIRRSERRPLLGGLGAFAMGLVVGLTKPNGLALVPALGVWGLVLARDYARELDPGHSTPRWAALLSDRNPGWAPLLGALGLTVTTSWWFYQTSGFYPLYILLVQRTLWWKEFQGGSLSSFGYAFHTAYAYMRSGLADMLVLQRMIELANIVFGLALALSHLRPRWPGGVRIPIPLHWRAGILSVYALMFVSGQSHGIERYAASNIFVALAWYRVVFGAPGQSVEWRVWTLPGLVRWAWLVLGPVTWLLSFTLLGWSPLK